NFWYFGTTIGCNGRKGNGKRCPTRKRSSYGKYLIITSFQRPSEHFRHPFTWVFDENILPENLQPIPENPPPDGDRLLSDQDCHTLGRQFNGSWSILLGDLGIPLRHKDNIKEDYRRNEEKKIAVFRLWKQINPGLTVRSVYRKLRELRVDMDCFAFLDPSGIILGEILNPLP
uniref:Death domain-containing protein n=1 Tax=Ciona savignyi TaxID=51511 RepID=H2Y8D4_CIOSA